LRERGTKESTTYTGQRKADGRTSKRRDRLRLISGEHRAKKREMHICTGVFCGIISRELKEGGQLKPLVFERDEKAFKGKE